MKRSPTFRFGGLKRAADQLPVDVADEMFSATVIGVPDCVAAGTSEEEALNNATRMLKARLAKGDLFDIEVEGLPSPVSANPWLEIHGSLRDDPTFDDFMTEISSYRQENDQGIRLTDRDRDLFLAALDADERPNAALRQAAQRFKRRSA